MIQLRIHEESDLYNPFDPSGNRINDEVYRYLKLYCTEMEANKHLHDTLQILSDTPIDAAKFKRTLLSAVKKDQDEFDRQIALNHKRAMRGYVIGISLSIIGFALSILLDQVLLEIISFVGTMAVKDAVLTHTKVNPDIKRLKNLLDPYKDFKLEVALSEKS